MYSILTSALKLYYNLLSKFLIAMTFKHNKNYNPTFNIAAEVTKVLGRPPTSHADNNQTYNDAQVAKWVRMMTILAKNFGRLSAGNLVHVFRDGYEATWDMLHSIDEAKERVWLEVYIFDDSELSKLFVEALKKAARRGCNVIVVADYCGSFPFSETYRQEMEECGIRVELFNPITSSGWFEHSFAFRDHKKLLIIDDKAAYCGSANVCTMTTNAAINAEGAYYDLHARVKGPAVYDIAQVFLNSLKLINGSKQIPPLFPRPAEIPHGGLVQVLEADVSQNKRDIQSFLHTIISNAEKNIYLTTSYFYPPGFLRRALQNAKRRNLEFHMLLSGHSDIVGDCRAMCHILTKFFRRRFAEPLTDNFRVYLTKGIHCHGKAIVVDDVWSSIGSFNWDRFSSRRNMEVALGIFDPAVAQRLQNLQRAREKQSEHYTRLQCFSRPKTTQFVDWIIYHWARCMGRNMMDGLSNEGFKFKFRQTFTRTFIEQGVSRLIATTSMPGV